MPLLRSLRARLDSLDVRVPALLTVALLPVGLIGVIQTAQVDAVAREREEVTFLALTERAATRQRREIERAVGTAQGLVATARITRGDPERCAEAFAPFVEPPYGYAFAGYVDAAGILDCSASGQRVDFSEAEDFAAYAAEPDLMIAANPDAAVSGRSVVIVTVPVLTEDGAFDGFVSLSLPQDDIASRTAESINLVTFNGDGRILTPDEAAGPEMLIPEATSLADLAGEAARVFEGTDGAGRDKVFALVPVIEGSLYALGSWDRTGTLHSGFGRVPVWTFPILMWLASLAVAYFAVHRLVIRHVRTLLAEMRAFAMDRELPDLGRTDMPGELDEIEAGLAELAERVVRDEAEAENRLHEQKVMMKEIHHRVKNNLQLISSLINMQMRQLRNPETKFALGRVRDRVLGLATIHRGLYEGTDVTGIEADQIVSQIVDQLVNSSAQAGEVRTQKRLEPVRLYPDQAVPLSLFVTEAITNALKYALRPEDGTAAPLAIEMSQTDGIVRLSIINEASVARPEGGREGAGLGRDLIAAFASQLGGEVETVLEDGTFRVTLTFAPREFDEAPAASVASAA